METLATLPLVLAVVLVELAVGGAFLVWFIDRTTEAPTGFLKLAALVDASAIAFAALLVPTLPRGELARAAGLSAGPVGAFGQAIVVVLVLVLLQLVAAFLPWRRFRDVSGILAVLGGVVALGIAATTRAITGDLDPLAIAALPLGALALGGSDGAMLLGHWYLVTPKLSPRPLQRAALVVVTAVVLQSIVVAGSVLRGDLVGFDQTALWIPVALRVGVGLLMTFFVALAAWWTARMNTQSSTGLLYVGLGTVLAGEVSARIVFFLTGAAL
jgi:hypothetical protein